MASPLSLHHQHFNVSYLRTLFFLEDTHHVLSASISLKPITSHKKPLITKSLITKYLPPPFSLKGSDSTKRFEPSSHSLLQQLSDSFNLPEDYFAKLPSDLRLDLNDAAFDLSNGPILDECGQDLGEILLNIARAWEVADASTSHALTSKLPTLEGSLTGNAKSAFGRRLVSAGKRFKSMGQYDQGELQKIANLMVETGNILSATATLTKTDEQPKEETKVFKFGELQVEVTPQGANIGAAIGIIFSILSWELAQGIQNIPESSVEYANNNALMVAKSLRGVLLALFYTLTLLSGFTAIGLFLLARQLNSKDK